jgi:hypothetical protein
MIIIWASVASAIGTRPENGPFPLVPDLPGRVFRQSAAARIFSSLRVF